MSESQCAACGLFLLCRTRLVVAVVVVCFFSFEYESTDSSREEMKRKFAPTMEFVEEYLKDVVSQHFPFGDKDKNELTLEVKDGADVIVFLIFPNIL